jgi:hypothetical protein
VIFSKKRVARRESGVKQTLCAVNLKLDGRKYEDEKADLLT